MWLEIYAKLAETLREKFLGVQGTFFKKSPAKKSQVKLTLMLAGVIEEISEINFILAVVIFFKADLSNEGFVDVFG